MAQSRPDKSGFAQEKGQGTVAKGEESSGPSQYGNSSFISFQQEPDTQWH